jgi:hypothetical protein
MGRPIEETSILALKSSDFRKQWFSSRGILGLDNANSCLEVLADDFDCQADRTCGKAHTHTCMHPLGTRRSRTRTIYSCPLMQNYLCVDAGLNRTCLHRRQTIHSLKERKRLRILVRHSKKPDLMETGPAESRSD